MSNEMIFILEEDGTIRPMSLPLFADLAHGRKGLTPFEFIKADELGLSRVIGWLLNPSGSHGQGARFLKMFFDEIKIPGR